MTTTPLFDILHETIEKDGPMPVSQFMSMCLGHPQHGYYMTKEVFGKDGDFTTAPEISQIFGEMIALWVILTWEKMGKPEVIQLVELGPGRGTLMRDIWRGLSALPALRDILHVHLVEFSPRLQAIQQETLNGVPVTWHTEIDTLPYVPTLIVANEFFDALPIEQAVRHQNHWYQRVVTTAEEDLIFSLGQALRGINLKGTIPDGAIYEYAPAAAQIMQDLCQRLYDTTGAMLVIDYGDDVPLGERVGDTLQALHTHEKTDVLDHVGNADLTAHVSFNSLRLIAAENLCATLPVQTQREFLTELGIRMRLDQLLSKATEEQAKELQSGVQRLVSADQMGDLFKVLHVFNFEG